MSVIFRNYIPEPLFGQDYNKLRQLYLDCGTIVYSFCRWDWMITHSYLDEGALHKIGLWEENGNVVAVATFDTQIDGNCFLITKNGYEGLYPQMIEYAEENLGKDGKVRLSIEDDRQALQNAAHRLGYFPTQNKDYDAVFDIDMQQINYQLPEGFSIADLTQRNEPYQCGRIMWKGFNHELKGEGAFSPTPEQLKRLERQIDRPNVNPSLKIAVIAPDGNFAAFCGMWQDNATQNAFVEPVATDPQYRKMGLGRAAVLEGIRRCGKLGAKRAYVGSCQQFYYNIGFKPRLTSTFWEKKQ